VSAFGGRGEEAHVKFEAEDKTIKHWNWSFLTGEHYLPMEMDGRQ
jgi:hypothetical protein